MRSVICAIAKNENAYINEWVNHYISIGFDHIYLYDNNDSSTPYVLDFIDNKEAVTIIDIRDQHFSGMQTDYYLDFYNKYNNTFDWVAFFDIDEFLDGVDNINDFLSQDKFKDYNQIQIKWRIFGDEGCIDRDRSIPVYEFFKTPLPNHFKANEFKSIIRGHMPEKLAKHRTHFVLNEKNEFWKACLPSGIPNTFVAFIIDADYSKETVYLNHYITKTLAEFIEQKMNRGDCQFSKRKISFNYYWQTNVRTIEKVKYVIKYEQKQKAINKEVFKEKAGAFFNSLLKK